MVTVYIDIYKVSLESSLQGNILIYISMLVLKTFLHGMITKNDRMSKTCSSYYISKYIHCNLDIVKNLVSGVYFTIRTFFTIQPVFCFKMKILSAPHFYYIKVFYYSAVYYIQVKVYLPIV